MELTSLISIAVWFGGNAAIASLVAVLVDLLKRIPGLVADGTSGQWAAGLNLAALAGFSYYFVQSGVTFDVVNAQLENVLKLSGLILAYVLQLQTSPAVHQIGSFSALPLLGYSLSDN
jgi:hypothetical protein